MFVQLGAQLGEIRCQGVLGMPVFRGFFIWAFYQPQDARAWRGRLGYRGARRISRAL